MALAVMKFLDDTRPIVGFSSLFGTGGFLLLLGCEGAFGVGSRTSFVWLFMKVFGSGWMAPGGFPMVAAAFFGTPIPVMSRSTVFECCMWELFDVVTVTSPQFNLTPHLIF